MSITRKPKLYVAMSYASLHLLLQAKKGLQSSDFIKKTLQPVDIMKFLRTSLFIEHL